VSSLPSKHIRRAITIPVLALGLILAVAVSPVVVPILTLIDLVTGSKQLRRTRLWLLIIASAYAEWGGAFIGNMAMIRFGWRRNNPGWLRVNERAQFFWVEQHLRNVRRFAGVKIEVENPEECSVGNAIVLSHHTSHIDAVLSAYLFGPHGGLHIQYTLKETLQWLPGLDIVGGNLPNVWINRRPEPGSPMFDRIKALGACTNSANVSVIFPEGTFYTPERLQKGADKVAERRPDLEPMVRGLRHCLPVRPGGVMALLEGAPEADIVIVGHAGLERFVFLSDIASKIPSDVPWKIHMWRFARATLPTDRDELLTWLTERWVEMDNWIEQQVNP